MQKEQVRSSKAGRRLALGVALLWLAGCAPNALKLDYGNAVRNNVAQQVLNPRAGLTQEPTRGLPPQAAANEMEHYDKTFKGEEKRSLEMKLAQ